MQRTPLKSSAVLSAGYDEARQVLELEFRNGRVYRYFDVPEGVYQFLMRTPSKGGYVNRMIESQYRHEQVGAESSAQQDLASALRASLAARGVADTGER